MASGKEFRVAIVGGGPGGLFAAWHLEAKAGATCKVTIYEATDRLGGKISTGSFPGIGIYEAGAAEIYDYSTLGQDPLRELIEKELGLEIKHISGGACILDGHVLQDINALGPQFGMAARDVAHAFRQRCARLMSPGVFYRSDVAADNRHPWASISAAEILAQEIKDETARRYIRVMAHSDVAVPPHLTTGLNFLKNVLMDVEGYLSVYSIVGGNEQIVARLAREISADIRLNSVVRAIEPLADGTYRIQAMTDGASETAIADFVVLALPLTALSIMDWRSPALRRAMEKHVAYFDRPGHYVRATLLFERPFWREHVTGNWFMLDAFDGCCVYDESSRNEMGGSGALSFLIAGNAALGLANMSDDRIEQLCLDALPPQMQHARALLVDRRIHRWVATVNAVPGGLPERSRLENHRPDPQRLPGLFAVGDYMFDATLNGVLDSADTASDLILSDIIFRRLAERQRLAAGGEAATPLANELLRRVFDASLLADLIAIAYGMRRGGKILCIGMGMRAVAAELRTFGFDACSIEQRFEPRMIAGGTAGGDLIADMADLPFTDGCFDVAIERGLCGLARTEIAGALRELRRVTRSGIVLGSVTTDLAIDLIERFELAAGVETLTSRWDWSEMMFASGFEHALADPARLARAWKRAEEAGAGPGHWYEDADALNYCFYRITEAAAHWPEVGRERGDAHDPAAMQRHPARTVVAS